MHRDSRRSPPRLRGERRVAAETFSGGCGMKLTFVGALIALCFAACPAPALTLVRDGRAVAKVYVSGPLTVDPTSKLPPAERAVAEAPIRARAQAVRDLNYHLEKMSGAA